MILERILLLLSSYDHLLPPPLSPFTHIMQSLLFTIIFHFILFPVSDTNHQILVLNISVVPLNNTFNGPLVSLSFLSILSRPTSLQSSLNAFLMNTQRCPHQFVLKCLKYYFFLLAGWKDSFKWYNAIEYNDIIMRSLHFSARCANSVQLNVKVGMWKCSGKI